MAKKPLPVENPNHKIFIVSTEDGGDDEDNMNSMIGDAVMKHVDNLSPADRQLWEELIIMGQANIFRIVPSFEPNDRDPLNLRSEELDEFFNRNNIPEDAQVMYREAIQVEKERREQSEDVLDKDNLLISWEEWQENPGLGQHVDLPTTPKPISVYMGNTTQMFYDDFPEGHPDSNLINSVINMLNRDIDDLTPKYAKFIKQTINNSKSTKYVNKYLTEMVDKACADDCNEKVESIIRKTLKNIDSKWSNEYRNSSIEHAKNDPMTSLLIAKHDEWVQESKKGVNLTTDIRSFGKTLWEDFRQEMKNYHWQMYTRLKKKFSPKVIIKGIDINRCRFSEYERVLGVSRNDAMKLFHERPWSSKYELENKNIVIGVLNDEIMTKIINVINNAFETSKKNKDRVSFSNIATSLARSQSSEKNTMSNVQWNAVWQHYNSCKSELFGKEINNE